MAILIQGLRISNGEYKSVQHRVLANSWKEARMSIVIFFQPDQMERISTVDLFRSSCHLRNHQSIETSLPKNTLKISVAKE
ncbi:hypothetical protein DVH24_019213 [Malus domestica]|uniref:Isopenicillin N synthase-like Fe(2+) 2OG dioxygenase domain-containing protein n=1 Tax=Malus domestica TaxID=3750 RepID=A0A498I2S2_MALDO|nr:hypothetical protein DVH24_019213 [Malus domestica]